MHNAERQQPQMSDLRWFHLNGLHYLHVMFGTQGVAHSNLSITVGTTTEESYAVLRRQEQ
jgi:heme/copper-type cytochrome/quinol oxidase subunit 3